MSRVMSPHPSNLLLFSIFSNFLLFFPLLTGSIVFPGAGYIAMMIAASGSSHTVFLEDVAFKSALVFSDKDTPRKTQVALNSSPAKPPTSVSVSLLVYTVFILLLKRNDLILIGFLRK